MSNLVQESINKAINTIVERRINALKLDKTVIAIIDSVVNAHQGLYRVKYDGGYFEAKAQQENAIYLKNMPVYVQIPQNDMTQTKIIIGRAYNLREEAAADAVISAINNYAIIGNNNVIINNKTKNDMGIALRSYHDPSCETGDDKEVLLQHRAQLIYDAQDVDKYLYSINKETLSLYLKNATAIMVEADFRTTLDSKQKLQYDGSYGVGLNMVFKNSNYEYGETQGEIFDVFSKDIKTTTVSLFEYDNEIKNAFRQQTYEDLIKTDGYLDMYISYISSLVDTYSIQHQDIWVPKEEEIVSAYLLLLETLKKEENLENIQARYNEWRNLQTGAAETKTVCYVLDSNMMTGNPYSYSSWSTQYAIFNIDINTFDHIENILFYKDGFLLDENLCTHGVDGNNNGVVGEEEDLPKEDIFIRNLKIYALQPISSINGDFRLEIQSKEQGLIFKTIDEEEQLKIKGKVTKAYYEDLSDSAAFYWFKKSPNVTSAAHTDYHQYGGTGWKYLANKGNKKNINLYANDNKAYENKYKCVAVIDSTTVLADEFVVYNTSINTKLKLESDLGTAFSFDAGKPLITCLMQQGDSSEYQENLTNSFNYTWAITIDGEMTFLDSLPAEDPAGSLPSIQSILKAQRLTNLNKDVQFYQGSTQIIEENKLKYATRINYPINNIALQDNAIFTCFVKQKNNDNEFYDIGSAELSIQNMSSPNANEFRLVLENSGQIFQYDEYGNAPNSSKLKDPLTIKPLIPHLFNPTGLEVPNSNYSVEWIVPIEESMLIFSEDKLYPNPAERNIKNIDKSKQCVFNISQLYNEDYQQNKILCKVKYNDKTFETTTDFYFGKNGNNGTNGTDMVLRVLPTSTASILREQPLTLYRYNYNSGSKKYSLRFNTGSTDSIIANGQKSGQLQIKLYQKGVEVTDFTSQWNIAGNTQNTTNYNGKNLKLTTSGTTYKIQWDDTYTKNYTNYIIRGSATYDGRNYYAFYNLPVITYNTKTLPNFARIGINEKTLLKEIVYNADGRNPIYSHNQGVELINVPDEYKVEWKACGGSVDASTSTSDSIKILKTKNTKKQEAVSELTTEAGSPHRIWILPNDEYKGGYCNHRIEANIKKDNNLIATAIIPIHLCLNTFGLASLNAWDGVSVTVDNDNGYVMAPQIGAGEKDSNNRFTGILMGKTETYTGKGKKEKETGLFGYAHGLQSIFLDAETGNAIFGLPDNWGLDNNNNWQNSDTYNEGRIELVPGGVSKVGGWHLGRGSLYYEVKETEDGGTESVKIGKAYTDGWAQKSGHKKDISPENRGILLNAVSLPYISIKGRPLTVYTPDKTGSASDYDIDNSSGNAALNNGDSLELNLDPNQRDFFTMFRHFKKNNKWNREPLVGIDAMGRFYTNALKDKETSLNMNYVPGFGKSTTDKKYIGLFIGYGTDTLFKSFIKNAAKSTDALYLSGGSLANEYIRPLSLHGENISLYASNSGSTATTTSSKIIISNTQFYGGNTDSSHIHLPASGTANITTVGSNIIKSAGLELRTPGNQNINLRTNIDAKDSEEKDISNNYSYLKLDADGSASILGATSLIGYARNSNITLNAQSSGATKSQLILANSGNSKLETVGQLSIKTNGGNLHSTANVEYIVNAGTNIGIFGSGTGTGTATGSKPEDRPKSNHGIYMPSASTNTNAFFKVIRPLDITSTMGMNLSSGGAINIKTSGTQSGNIINIENTNYTPSNGQNALNVSTKIGGFAIQRNTSMGNNVYSSDLGLRMKYGYFDSVYNNSNYSVYANQNIYAGSDIYAANCIVRGTNGANRYGFNQDDTVSYGSFSITGGSVGALFEALLSALNSWKSSVDSSLSKIAGDISTLQGNVNNLSSDIYSLSSNVNSLSDSLDSLRSAYNNHRHNPGPGAVMFMETTQSGAPYISIDGTHYTLTGATYGTQTSLTDRTV